MVASGSMVPNLVLMSVLGRLNNNKSILVHVGAAEDRFVGVNTIAVFVSIDFAVAMALIILAMRGLIVMGLASGGFVLRDALCCILLKGFDILDCFGIRLLCTMDHL